MKVVVHWSGGKDCCTALHKVVEQGHEVACLVTYIYMEPYVFHSFKVIEQQVKSLGMPHQFVKITDNRYDDIMGTLERLHKEEASKQSSQATSTTSTTDAYGKMPARNSAYNL